MIKVYLSMEIIRTRVQNRKSVVYGRKSNNKDQFTMNVPQ